MILMYHKVDLDDKTLWWVDVDNFYRQMLELSDKTVVYLDDYNPACKSQVVITFDGIYKNVARYAAPILRKFGFPFELFVTSDYIGIGNEFDAGEPAAEFADESDLAYLIACGGRLQWHTKSHRDLSTITDQEVLYAELDVPAGIKSLDSAGFGWFAYPYGRISDFARDCVSKRFSGAVSCSQGSDTDRYALNRITVTNSTKLSATKVAVIIASYNYGRFMPEAVESVLLQSMPVDEILIADDCSHDNTEEIASEYVAKHPELIRYIRNPSRLGTVGNFNSAIKHVSSDYICFLGADNRLLSNYIEKCYQVLSSSEAIGIAYTDYALFGSRARAVYERNYREELKQGSKGGYWIINFPEYSATSNDFVGKFNFIHGSSMYKLAAFNDVGGYQEASGRPEDYDLFTRMMRKGWLPFKASGTYLEYRQHSSDQLNEAYVSVQEKLLLRRRIEKLEKDLAAIYSSKPYRISRILVQAEIRFTHGLKSLVQRIRQDGIRKTARAIIRRLGMFFH